MSYWKKLHLIIFIAVSLLAVSCAPVDDINEIFVGKTWYMTGGRLNSQDLNKEVKTFYEAGTETYKLHFQDNIFTGTLAAGKTFSGRWNVDAKSRNLSMTITKEAETSSTFDHNIYTVLKGIRYYEGDSNYLIIYSDKDNYIRLHYER